MMSLGKRCGLCPNSRTYLQSACHVEVHDSNTGKKLRINALAAHSFVVVAQGGVEASGCPLEVDLVADAESRQNDEKYR